MILYIRYTKNSTGKHLEMISSAMWQDTGSRKHLQQWCWGNFLSTHRRKKLDQYLSPFTKTKLQTDQRPQAQTWKSKPPVRKHSQYLHDRGIGNDCLVRISLAQELRSTIRQQYRWDFMKLKVFHTTEITINRVKCEPRAWWESLSAIHLLEV